MNWIGKALHGLGSMISNLFTSDAARQSAAAKLKQAGEIAVQIYPVIEAIAAATPNRTDDEIVAAIKKFGVLGLVDPNETDKAGVLHNIALAVVKNTIASTVPSSLISMAIETAYQVYQANATTPKAK